LRKYEAGRNMLTLLTWTFPLQMQRCIYTTNWIERLNRKYKRTIGMGASMPSDKSALSSWQVLSWKRQIQHMPGRFINGNSGTILR